MNVIEKITEENYVEQKSELKGKRNESDRYKIQNG